MVAYDIFPLGDYVRLLQFDLGNIAFFLNYAYLKLDIVVSFEYPSKILEFFLKSCFTGIGY
jgi:hypothetical protein